MFRETGASVNRQQHFNECSLMFHTFLFYGSIWACFKRLITFKRRDGGLSKKINIMGIHRKIHILVGGELRAKTIYRVDCLKRGFGQFADLRRDLAKKSG